MANAGQAPIASTLSETEIRNAQQACEALAIEYAEIVDAQEYERLREIFAEDATLVRRSIAQETVRGCGKNHRFVSRRARATGSLITSCRIFACAWKRWKPPAERAACCFSLPILPSRKLRKEEELRPSS